MGCFINKGKGMLFLSVCIGFFSTQSLAGLCRPDIPFACLNVHELLQSSDTLTRKIDQHAMKIAKERAKAYEQVKQLRDELNQCKQQLKEASE